MSITPVSSIAVISCSCPLRARIRIPGAISRSRAVKSGKSNSSTSLDMPSRNVRRSVAGSNTSAVSTAACACLSACLTGPARLSARAVGFISCPTRMKSSS
ncbi:hypothetical protein D3C86_1514660 [compost metagenome]